MVALIIFWASLFCVLSFLLGTVFKGLYAFFTGFVYSSITFIAVTVLAILGVTTLMTLYGIANGIRTDGLGSFMGTFIPYMFVVVIIFSILGGFGSILLGITLSVLEIVIGSVSFMLDQGSIICEKVYVRFLTIIIKQLEKS